MSGSTVGASGRSLGRGFRTRVDLISSKGFFFFNYCYFLDKGANLRGRKKKTRVELREPRPEGRKTFKKNLKAAGLKPTLKFFFFFSAPVVCCFFSGGRTRILRLGCSTLAGICANFGSGRRCEAADRPPDLRFCPPSAGTF